MDDYIVIEQSLRDGDEEGTFKITHDNGKEYTYKTNNKAGDPPLPGVCPEGEVCGEPLDPDETP